MARLAKSLKSSDTFSCTHGGGMPLDSLIGAESLPRTLPPRGYHRSRGPPSGWQVDSYGCTHCHNCLCPPTASSSSVMMSSPHCSSMKAAYLTTATCWTWRWCAQAWSSMQRSVQPRACASPGEAILTTPVVSAQLSPLPVLCCEHLGALGI